jgi:hypothetical protein
MPLRIGARGIQKGTQVLMRKLPGFTDVNRPQHCGTVSISGQLLDDTLLTMPSDSGKSRRMFTLLNQYHVVMEVDPKFRQGPQGLRNLPSACKCI